MNQITSTLFPFFPRQVGIPRTIVKNKKEMDKYIQKFNGTNIGCHTSLYDFNSYPVIDKLLFDFDGKDLNVVFDEVKNFVQLLQKKNFLFIPVFSGKKGFHIYILLKPERIDKNTGKFLLHRVESELVEGFKTVDWQKVGDIGAMIRIPNTINNGRYCCCLPENFTEMKLSEILSLSKNKNYFNINLKKKKLPSLLDLANITMETADNDIVDIPKGVKRVTPPFKRLKDLIRPCIYNELKNNPNPKHLVRFDLVSELFFIGYTPTQVYKIIENLNWSDFKPDLTMYFINDIFANEYMPPSCERLSREINCTKCGWKYWWIQNGD